MDILFYTPVLVIYMGEIVWKITIPFCLGVLLAFTKNN